MLSIIATPDFSTLANGLFRITITIEETDALLKSRFVSGSIDWGDSQTPTTIAKQAILFGNQIMPVVYSRNYAPGKYVVKVTAQNYRSPTPDTDLFVVFVDASTEVLATPVESKTVSIGPILPRDTGFPNPEQWNFNIGRDLETTESAVKMLLSTAKGERLMDPEYGTNLSRLIFDPDDGTGAIDSLVQDEILQAVEKFAPFVTVQSISVTRSSVEKKVAIEIRFVAKPKQQTFSVNLNFER